MVPKTYYILEAMHDGLIRNTISSKKEKNAWSMCAFEVNWGQFKVFWWGQVTLLVLSTSALDFLVWFLLKAVPHRLEMAVLESMEINYLAPSQRMSHFPQGFFFPLMFFELLYCREVFDISSSRKFGLKVGEGFVHGW